MQFQNNMGAYHTPVMLNEVLKYLDIKRGGWYVDCNLGGGGHTEAILKMGGKVVGIDLDPDSMQEVTSRHKLKLMEIDNRFLACSNNLILYQTNFSQIKQLIDKLKVKPIRGILFDLGVSTHQLETPGRGFSFNINAPLDMRMDQTFKVAAKDLINALPERELANLFFKYGEEFKARTIARKIVEERAKKPIETTDQLAKIVISVRPRSKGDRTHPATRVFQALRIAVNEELYSLEAALPNALEVLAKQGRMVVISFHSLEDRIVKNFFRDEQKKGTVKILTQKPINPTSEEENQNPRSRSGKLRCIEKL